MISVVIGVIKFDRALARCYQLSGSCLRESSPRPRNIVLIRLLALPIKHTHWQRFVEKVCQAVAVLAAGARAHLRELRASHFQSVLLGDRIVLCWQRWVLHRVELGVYIVLNRGVP